jgi:hypothetical protein
MTSELSSKLEYATEQQSTNGFNTPDLVADEKIQQNEELKDFEAETEQGNPSTAVNEEYPTGRRLVPILLSLILVVFLVSLDMVSRRMF